MANELDEVTGPVNEAGRDARVIEKQVPVTINGGTKAFGIAVWFIPPIIGGVILWALKNKAEKTLLQLQQKIQSAASTIDNYLEQRVIILENLAALLNKEMEFEKETLAQITAYRGGMNPNGDDLNEAASKIENVNTQIKAVFERYPDLKTTEAFQKAMRDNDYLQREITAAREQYNSVIQQWNTQIYVWPVYQMVAAKKGYTTRIPFSTTSEMRQKAREVLF